MSDTNPTGSGAKNARLAAAFWEPKRQEIERLYRNEGWSMHALASRYGVTAASVCHAFRRMGIQARSRGTSGPQNGRFKDGSQSRTYRDIVVKSACEACGATPDPRFLDIHHRNGDHYDNRPENLQVLCRSCHMSETTRERWRRTRAGLPPAGNAPKGWSARTEKPV